MNTTANSTLPGDASRPSQTKSFSTIFLIEMWERFGYYGMAALLVLFMVQKLGYTDERANLTWGAFTALVYAAPAIGGWIGDKVLGARRSMTIGATILALGYLLLSVPSDNVTLLYGALGVIVVGNGLFKSNAANLVRRIYEGDDAKIDSAFTLYYMAVNIGSTFSMIATPIVAAKWGWHTAFALCCAGMVAGLLNYLLMRRTLDHVGSVPDDAPVNWGKLAMVLGIGVLLVFAVSFVLQHGSIARALVYLAGAVILAIFGYLIAKSGPGERSGQVVALVLTIETILFFIFYQQMSTSLTLFALRNVDWNQTLFGIHLFTWIPAQYQALNPIWIFALSPLLAWGYTRMASRGRDLPIAAKFAVGFIVVAVGFFIFGISGGTADAGKVSSWYMIWGYGFYSLGELLVSGLGLAMMARYVPARMGGFMMGAYFVATGISQYLGGIVANYASVPDNITDPLQSLPIYTSLFNKLGFVAAGGAVLAIALLPMLKKLSESHRDNNQAIDPKLVMAEER
jgi:POT family proton-dependent oligopeptide transporter